MDLFVADYGSDQKRRHYRRHNKKKHSQFEGENYTREYLIENAWLL
jgi:hypothetical protein